jgi:hypothetical protein
MFWNTIGYKQDTNSIRMDTFLRENDPVFTVKTTPHPFRRPQRTPPAKPPKPTEANRTTGQLYVARSPPAVATTNLTYFCLKCGNGAKLHLFAQESLALLRASLPERRPALLLAWPHTRLASSRQPDIRCGIHGFLVAQPLRKDGPLRSLP